MKYQSVLDYIVYTGSLQDRTGWIQTEVDAELLTQHILVVAELKNYKEANEKEANDRIKIYKLNDEANRRKYQVANLQKERKSD